jgi:hypothetical protein
MNVMGEGLYYYNHTYHYSMAKEQKEETGTAGFIEWQRQVDINTDKTKSAWQEIRISFRADMHHTVSPHKENQEEEDVNNFLFEIRGEMNTTNFSGE